MSFGTVADHYKIPYHFPTNPVGHCHQEVRWLDFGSIVTVTGGSAASFD